MFGYVYGVIQTVTHTVKKSCFVLFLNITTSKSQDFIKEKNLF